MGLFKDGRIQKMKYGKLAEIFKEVTEGLTEFTVAGMHRNTLTNYETDIEIQDSGIEKVQPEVLLKLKEVLVSRKVVFPDFVKPITENSALFKEEEKFKI